MKSLSFNEYMALSEEELNELSKDTLKSYGKKAIPDMQASQKSTEYHIKKASNATDDEEGQKHYDAATKAKDRTDRRIAGITGAVKRIQKEDVNESPFDKTYKSQIDWSGKKVAPTVSKEGGLVYKARTDDRNPESGANKDKQSVGRPKGQYGKYKIDAAARADPKNKEELSKKVMAAKAGGYEVRAEYKTALDAAIKKRQEELWAKTK